MRKKYLAIPIAATLLFCCAFPVACTGGVEPSPLAAPAIRLDGNVVGWRAVDNAYTYDVYVNGEKSESTTELYYTVTATSAGDYEVKIKAVPSEPEYTESDFSNSVVYTAPAAVTKLATPTVSGRAGVVEWLPVPHATIYDVYLRGELLGTTTKYWYVLPELDDGNYEVKVVAKSTDPAYSQSDFGVYTYRAEDPVTSPLDAPVITLSGNTVSWAPVPHATGYDVYINGSLKASEVTETSYAVTQTEYGRYTVTVVAKSTDEAYTDSAASNAVVYEIKRPKLAAPVISLNGNTVSWQAVSNATSYEVYIDGIRRATVNVTSYTVTVSAAGTYAIKIKAVGTGFDSSDYSNTAEYTYVPPAVPLSAPVISLDGDTVSWTAVENAASYKIYINDALKATVSDTSYTITETATGNYTVKVRAVPSDAAYAESSPSNGVVYSVAAPDAQALAAPTVSVSGVVASWAVVENADTYDVYCDGTLIGSTDGLEYSLDGITLAGDYSITVVAKPSDLALYKNSVPSAPAIYNVAKVPSYIAITSLPEKDLYFTDEAQAGLILDGLTAEIHYGNFDGVDPVTLTAADASGYDLTVPGRYEVEFTKNGVVSDTVRIYVRERTVDDVAEYITVVNGYDPAVTEYAVSDSSFTATTAYMSDGSDFAVTSGKISASALHEGENFVRLSDGETSVYALVKVARIITNADEFKNISTALNGYYMLGGDIDFGGKGFTIGKAPLLIEWENKAEQKASKVYASRDGVGCAEAPGELFTGTLDGCGYILKNFAYRTGDGGYSKRWTTSGVALFGGVGKTGVIRNLILRDFHVNSTGACALLTGYNGGLIENICIEEDCSVGYHWDAGAGISAYNYGVVRNCVSHVETVTLDRVGSQQPMYLTHFGGSSYEVDNGVNGYVGGNDDLTDILGDGWYFIPGYGTYYGNIHYKKLLSYDSVWYATVPSRVTVFHAKPGLTGVYIHSWGGAGGEVPTKALSTGVSPNTSRITTYECTLGTGFTAGTSVTAKIKYGDDNKYFCSMAITIGEPYPVSASCGESVSVYQGGIIALEKVDLTVTMSDGSSKTVNPTSYDSSEFDSSLAVGTVQNVTFFYNDGAREVETKASVTIVDPPDTPYATALNITKKAESVSYAKGSAPDFDDALEFTAALSDGNTRTLTLSGDSTLTVGEYAPGHKTVEFTYVDPNVSVRVTQTVEIDIVYTIADKEDWKLMNTYLDGYFELKADLDLGGVAENNNPLVIGKLPLTSANDTDSAGVGNEAAQLGVAFTGRFNGNGHKVKGFVSDYTKNTAPAAWASTSYGLVPFAFVGDGGVVENFTLDGANIKCGQSGSLLVGLNRGTVRNIVIENNCSLIVNYGGDDTGAIANVNCGTLSDITCRTGKFIGHESAEKSLKKTVFKTDGGTETNCTVETVAVKEAA